MLAAFSQAVAGTDANGNSDYNGVPAEVKMEAVPGEHAARIHVRVHMLDPYFVISGQDRPLREGNRISLNATAQRVTFIRPPNEPVIFDLVYDVDGLRAGTYTAVFALNGSPSARIQFDVGVVAPPPHRPEVASLEIGNSGGTYFARLAVAVPHHLADAFVWGEVQRSSDAFVVHLAYQRDGVSPDSTNSVTGFPVRLLTHAYRLGSIDPGSYSFVVAWGDQRIAVRHFEVFDPELPTARLHVRDVLVAGAEGHPFLVIFSDSEGMDLASIRSARPFVSGPHGFSSRAEVVSVVAEDDHARRVRAEYVVGAPGGFWDAVDRGGYRIAVDPESIRDVDGHTLPRGGLGGFRAFVLPDTPPDDAPGRLEMSAREVDGVWGVDVVLSFGERPFTVRQWGGVKVAGNVFSVNAGIAPPLSDTPPTDRAVWRHTYRLGALHPGAYFFVFTSNLGHLQRLFIEVPGESVTDLFGKWSHAVAGLSGETESSYLADAEFDDPDADGVVNLLEYAFGLDPLTGPGVSPVNLVLIGGEEGNTHLGLSFSRAVTASDLVYIVEVSIDLVNWSSGGELVEIVDVREGTDGTETVTVCLHQPVGESPYPYIRLRVSRAAGEQ